MAVVGVAPWHRGCAVIDLRPITAVTHGERVAGAPPRRRRPLIARFRWPRPPRIFWAALIACTVLWTLLEVGIVAYAGLRHGPG